MNRKILLWMIVMLVMVSAVIVDAENKTTSALNSQDITNYKNALKNYETVNGKLSAAGKTERIDAAVDKYLKQNPAGTEEDFYKSEAYKNYKQEEIKLNNEKESYKKKIIKLEKTSAVKKNFKKIQEEAAAEKKAVAAAAADKRSVSKLVSNKFNERDKANTYEIGGSNYIKVGDNLFEKVGSSKRSRFTRGGDKSTTTEKETKKEYYAFDENDLKLQKELTKEGVTIKTAIQPVKYDKETMEGNQKDPTTWKYKDNKKLNGDLAGTDVKLPKSLLNTKLAERISDYNTGYSGVNVNLMEKGYTVKGTVGGSKLNKDEQKRLKKTGWLGNMFGGSDSKEILFERGQTIFSNPDDPDDVKVMEVQQWETKGKNIGEFKGSRYYYKDEDGNMVDTGVVIDSSGAIIKGNPSLIPNKNARDKVKKSKSQKTFNRWVGSLNKAQAWSSISSLFGLELTEWKQTIDELFHSMFLGSDYWSEAICYQTSDLPDLDESSIFAYDADGNLMQTATIVATKQIITIPNGTQNNQKYLYKISYYVRNPQNTGNDKSSFSGRERDAGSSSGLSARGSMAGSSGEGLDKQEKEFWNVIKKGAKEISNTRSKSSRSGTDEDMEYNVELSGQRTISLFDSNEKLSPGDEAIYTKKDAIASYSVYNYDKACIVFDGEKPRNLFYEDIDEICADIIDISSETATTIPVTEGSSSSSKRTDNEFGEFSGSGGSSGGRGFTK